MFPVLRSIGIHLCKEYNSIKICRRYVTTIRACIVQEWREKEGDAAEDIAYLYPGISLVTGVPLECLTGHTPRLSRAEN